MARSRYFIERSVAHNALRFGAPLHITPPTGAMAGGEPTIHGYVDKIGTKYLYLTQMDGTKIDLLWSQVGWIEWRMHEATKGRRNLGYR